MLLRAPFFCLVLGLALAVPAARAEEMPAERYELRGRVTDPTGAVIRGARVELLTAGGATLRRAHTDAQGEFHLADVPAGRYVLGARAAGFEPQQTAVALPQKSGRDLSIVLRVGVVTTTVTVTPVRGSAEDSFALAGAVNLLGADKLDHRPAVILPQLLREEVGVTLQQTSAHQGAVIVRGLTGQQVVHLVDGIRFNNSTFRPGPNQYLALVEPSAVERIEVWRGPGSAQYGSDSLGGTVHLLTPTAYPAEGDRRLHGEFTPFFRTADQGAGATLRLSFGAPQWTLLGGAAGRRMQDLRAGGGEDSHAAVTRFLGLSSSVLGEQLQDTAFTQAASFLRFFWTPRASENLSAYYLRSEQRGGRRYDRLNGGSGNLLSSFDPQALDFFYARYEKLSWGKLDSMSGAFSYNRQRDDRREQGGSGNPLAKITDEFNETRVFGYQALGTAHLGAHQWMSFGGEVYEEWLGSERTEFDPVTRAQPAVRGRYPDGSRYSTYGLFYQHAGESLRGRLRAHGGLRYSAFRFRAFADRNLDATGQALVPDARMSLQDVTFNAGAALRLRSSLQVYANLSRGFRAPNASDLGSVGRTSNGFEVTPEEAGALNALVGTTADSGARSTGEHVGSLNPEVLYSYEAGVKFQKERASGSVSLFQNEFSDFITRRALLLPAGAMGQSIGGETIIAQLPSGAVITGADPRPVLIRANAGQVRIRGIEASARGQFTTEWSLQAGFHYLRGTDKRKGGPPDIEGGLPPATGFAGVRWQPQGRRYWLETYAHVVRRQDRLSSLELADQRIGALRSRADIAAFFANGAVARDLVRGGILLATGETLAQVQDRVLGLGVDGVPLFTKTPGFVTANLRGGYRVGEQGDLVFIVENLLDKNYRLHGSGVDSPGINLQLSYRLRF